jgi:HNH endonuclease
MSYESDALTRDGYHCFRCGKPVPDPWGRNCHHRLPVKHGGPDTLDNRISLCGFGNHLTDADGVILCHGFAHQRAKTSTPAGWLISQHDVRSPVEIPALHWALGMVYLPADGRLLPEASVIAWTVADRQPLTEADTQLLEAV